MSSSSSTVRSPRVLRGTGAATEATPLLSLDLAPTGLARLDPARVEAAVTEGREAGYVAGFAAAQAAAREEMAALTRAHRAQLARLLEAVERGAQDALDGVARAAEVAAEATAAAAFAVAEAIVGRELSTAVHPGRDAVARALALTPEGVDVSLRLHPDDAADLLDMDLVTPGRVVTIVPDPTVTSGDCIAQAGWTRVDARIDAALERVRSVLEGQR